MIFYFAYVHHDWSDNPPKWEFREEEYTIKMINHRYRPTKIEAMVEAVKDYRNRTTLDQKHISYRNFVWTEYTRLLDNYPEYFV